MLHPISKPQVFGKKMNNFRSKYIGSLSGKVLVFGGAYSNLQALEALRNIATEKNISPTNIICTGDVVGYCAQPEEVVQSVKEWGIHSICGNVEIQIREGKEDCGCNFEEESACNIYSKSWYPYAQSRLSKNSVNWMKDLPNFLEFDYDCKSFKVLHGSYTNVSEFIFKSTSRFVKSRDLTSSFSDVVLAGHSGLPFNQVLGEKHWLNPGVIGMPANDGTSRVWYMLLDDTDGFSFSHHSYEYDHLQAAHLMREALLPEQYALTLSTGLWDNCDVLPLVETEQQGVPIDLDKVLSS